MDGITKEERRALEYLENIGGDDLLTSDFDNDFEPIGPTLRKQLTRRGLAFEFDGWIGTTKVGIAVAEALRSQTGNPPTPAYRRTDEHKK